MKIKAALLVALFFCTQVAAARASEIVVRDADSVWKVIPAYSAELMSATSNVSPRILVRHSGSIYGCNLRQIPTDLAELTGELTSTRRLIVNQAGSICQLALSFPSGLPGVEAPGPDILLSAISYDFGEILVSSSSSWVLVVSNVGTLPLVVDTLTSSHPDFALSPEAFEVAREDSQRVTVIFTPSSVGSREATLTIESNDPDESRLEILLAGTGIAPDIVLSATSHNFGRVTVDSSSVWTLSLSNVGNASLSVALASSKSEFEVSPDSLTVPAGDSSYVSVTFKPTSGGSKNAVLIVTSNDPDEGYVEIPLTGRGNTLPTISLVEPTGEQSGDVMIGYRLSDAENDTLSIVCEYDSIGTWVEATLIGRTAEIKPFEYVGSVIWSSKADLPETAGNISIRITPRDRDMGIADTVFVLLDNLGLPSIQLSDLSGEQEGQVRISYTLTDEEYDPITLFSEYSIDSGRTYKAATVTGKTAGMDSSGYVGSLLWESAADLPGADRTAVRFRITPNDAHTGIFDETNDFHVDNNAPPSVTLSDLQGEQTEDISIRYTLSDAEGDTVTIRCAYSRDGKTWSPATIVGDTVVAQSRYTGQIVWRSLVDLPNVSGRTYFQITSHDKDPGQSGVVALQLDNIRAAITLVDPVGEQTGDVTIRYLIGNEGGGPVNLDCAYSEDSGATWHRATVAGDTVGIDSTRYHGSLVWKSGADLPEVDKGTVRFRITPRDVRVGIPDETGDFHLDNNAPPSVVLRDMPEFQTGSIAIGYTLSDAEHDSLWLRCEVWDAGASAWVDAAVLGATEGISEYEGEMVWDTGKDLPEQAGRVPFRITPSDRDLGRSDTTVVLVDNAVPSISLTDPEGDQSGDVVIGMVIANDTLSVVSLACAYSEDGGSSWKAATVEGDTSGIGSDGYAGEVVWKSRMDLPDRDVGTVRFQITPRDVRSGRPDETRDFHLDNLAPASITASGAFGGNTIALRFNEGVDQASATVPGNYTLDHDFTVSSVLYAGPDSVVLAFPEGQTLPFEEVTVSVMGVRDLLGNPITEPIRATFKPGNTPPVVALEEITEELSGDVTIRYTVSDEEGHPVRLRCYFEGGQDATVVGDTIVDPGEGSIIWRSGENLPGVDKTVMFWIVPDDGDEGIADTLAFPLDNNDPPTVLSSAPSDPLAGTISIEYKLDDAEGDTLSIECLYSKNGRWHRATVSGDTSGIMSEGYQGRVQWDSIRDVGYGDTLTVRFRIVPRDRDEGSPGDTDVFRIRNWLGDYNHDLIFDIDDLMAFREAWRNRDGTRNIGPITGDPPNWVPRDDGKIDFEDLRVFVMMWNWWHSQPGSVSKPLARMSKSVFDGSDAPVQIGYTVSEDGLTLSFDVGEMEDVIGAELLVRYDPDKLRVREVKRGGLFPSEETPIVFLHHVDAERGIVLVDAICLGDPPKTTDGRRSVADLDFVRTKSASPRSETELMVSYDLRCSEPEEAHQGTIRKRMAFPPVPKKFSLYSNRPNPFNARTLIRYDLPERSGVSLVLYDISGRVVRRLVDTAQSAGRYNVAWDGRDEGGQPVGSGVYLVWMEAGRFGAGRKLLVLK